MYLLFSAVADAMTLNCRQVLNLMVFFGFMFNYMLRVNLTIAIVEMVARVNLTGIAGLANDTTSLTSQALNVTVSFLSPAVLVERRGGRQHSLAHAAQRCGLPTLASTGAPPRFSP